MDIKQLRALVALAEQGNYRQAASRLCISQPALSKQIQALETQLGVRLFERGRQGAVLTAGGQRLYPEAQVLVAQYQQFQQRARRVALGEAGRLSLGFGLSSFHLAPQLVAAFRQRFPEVAIGLEDLPSERQYQLLLQGELQAGFVRLPVNTPLCGVALLSDRLVLAAPGALALDIKLVIFVTESRRIWPKIERKEADTLFLKSSVTRYKALDTHFKAEFHANFCYIFKA